MVSLQIAKTKCIQMESLYVSKTVDVSVKSDDKQLPFSFYHSALFQHTKFCAFNEISLVLEMNNETSKTPTI